MREKGADFSPYTVVVIVGSVIKGVFFALTPSGWLKELQHIGGSVTAGCRSGFVLCNLKSFRSPVRKVVPEDQNGIFLMIVD